MASPDYSPNLDPVEDDIRSMNLKSEDASDEEGSDAVVIRKRTKKEEDADSDEDTPYIKMERQTSAGDSVKQSPHPSSFDEGGDDEETVGGDVLLKQEPGQPPKLERTGSRKVVARAPQMFDDYEDSTDEARTTFQVMDACTYASKNLGYTEHAMDCDCAEEWDAPTSSNLACGEDSDCINRATKMECVGDCGCGANCQNQRFQRKQYADIAIIKTEKKGYGVRANVDLEPNQFIFEYIGEVINERDFRKRMVQYDEDGIKHFYFMSLNKGEFIDATRRGNLGRFCNHSCNPNCYVDKWVVGDKLRMGIFAERRVRAGEELVFNYNVDRYGAEAQPCYCGEPNCIGVIGGKTQTERASKLPLATLEALGIDDGDGWDTTVAKRPRKKRAGEDDEQWVDSLQPMPLDEDGVTKVMAVLMQCKEKWIAVKLLNRIERCDEASVRGRVIRMHGYQILKNAITTFVEDVNVVLQILEILDSFPRVTRNKIADSKIEDVVVNLQEHEDERISEIANRLMEEWSKLEVAYRIPRIKRDPNAKRVKKELDDRRGRESRRRSRTRSRSRSPPPIDAPRGPSAPTGPKNHFPQRAPFARPFRPQKPLPPGWLTASFEGRTYYYTRTGQTSWTRPTAPAPAAPAAASANVRQKRLDDIIAEIERTNEKKAEEAKAAAAAVTPQSAKKDESREKKEKKPRWMSYDESKQMKLYENTIHPHIKHVVDKYKSKLPKETLKENFKSLSKKIVESDFRKKRVADPTKIDEKKQRDIKKFTKEYFDKLLVRHKEYEKKKAAKLAAKLKAKAQGKGDIASSENVTPAQDDKDVTKEESDDDAAMGLSDTEYAKDDASKSITPQTPLDQVNGESLLKRKRAAITTSFNGSAQDTDAETSPNKRMRSATPPPPPPPIEDMPSVQPSPVDMIPNGGWNDGGYEEQYDENNAPPPPPSAPGMSGPNEDEEDFGDEHDPNNDNEALQLDRSQALQI